MSVEQALEAVRQRIRVIREYHGIEESEIECGELNTLRLARCYLEDAIALRNGDPASVAAGFSSGQCRCGLHDEEEDL